MCTQSAVSLLLLFALRDWKKKKIKKKGSQVLNLKLHFTNYTPFFYCSYTSEGDRVTLHGQHRLDLFLWAKQQAGHQTKCLPPPVRRQTAQCLDKESFKGCQSAMSVTKCWLFS